MSENATTNETAAVLLGAAREVETYGLCKTSLNGEDGSVCAYAALNRATVAAGLSEDAYLGAVRALRRHLRSGGPRPANIVAWVAKPATSDEDVILTFKRAAYSLTAETPPFPADLDGSR